MLRVKTKDQDKPKNEKAAPKTQKKPSMPPQGMPMPSEEEMPELPMEQIMAASEPAMPPPDMMGGMEPPREPRKVDPSIVVYMSGEYGPFKCSNCVHFIAPNSCDVVAGEIDPEGLSRLYEPVDQGAGEEIPPELMAAALEGQAGPPTELGSPPEGLSNDLPA